MTMRSTAAQATIGFLKNQFSERDGKKPAFFAGTSYDERVPGYESWWDVPIAEVSQRDAVKAARQEYEQARKKERFF